MICDWSQMRACFVHHVLDASYSDGGPGRVDMRGCVALIQVADLLYVLKVEASP